MNLKLIIKVIYDDIFQSIELGQRTQFNGAQNI